MSVIKHVLAVTTSEELGKIGGEGLGPMGNLGLDKSLSGTTALTNITNIISSIIGIMTVIAGIWFIFMFLIGGYTWMTSMGDKQRLEQARDRIVNALIGLVIVVAGWGILALVGTFFGWDILINNPGKIIQQIQFAK